MEEWWKQLQGVNAHIWKSERAQPWYLRRGPFTLRSGVGWIGWFSTVLTFVALFRDRHVAGASAIVALTSIFIFLFLTAAGNVVGGWSDIARRLKAARASSRVERGRIDYVKHPNVPALGWRNEYSHGIERRTLASQPFIVLIGGHGYLFDVPYIEIFGHSHEPFLVEGDIVEVIVSNGFEEVSAPPWVNSSIADYRGHAPAVRCLLATPDNPLRIILLSNEATQSRIAGVL